MSQNKKYFKADAELNCLYRSTSQTTLFWLWEVLPKLHFFGFGKYFPKWPFWVLGSTSQTTIFWLWEVLPKVTIFDFRKYFPNWPFLALGSTSQTTIFWLWEVLPKLPFIGFGKYFPKQICREDYDLTKIVYG